MKQDYLGRLKLLREKISAQNAQGLIVPYNNCFQSEYMADCDHRLAWLTGFKGSAGLAVVLIDTAALFVDGRYTLQASQEIGKHRFSVQPYSLDSIKKWLEQETLERQILLYDPWLHTVQQLASYQKHLDPLGVILQPCKENLIDEIWIDRPALPIHPYIPHLECWSGKSSQDKLIPILENMRSKHADHHIITCPESVSWLLNIRGHDSPFTPSCQVFVVINHEGMVWVFGDLDKVTNEVRFHCGSFVLWMEPQQFLPIISSFSSKKILADFAQLPQKVFECLRQAKASVVHENDPCLLGRALKNAVEQKGAEAAHQRDGVAVINFLAWLDRSYRERQITEIEAADYLLEQRKKQEHFQEESFPTISAMGPHGAIVHYHANGLTNAILLGNSLYLIDSGGQYLDGTTDITRTIAIGEPTPEQKGHFTRVLKGHIALATAIFPVGTIGQQLDVLARQFLWQIGLDYEHSTGHGIGSYLNVHEGPHRIGKKGEGVALHAGMLVTNEPGYYNAGAYGIRIESVLLVVPMPKNGEGTFLRFKTLTLVPIDHRLIDMSLLTEQEISWINDYHSRVYDELSIKVDEHAKAWLQQATKPVKFCAQNLKSS